MCSMCSFTGMEGWGGSVDQVSSPAWDLCIPFSIFHDPPRSSSIIFHHFPSSSIHHFPSSIIFHLPSTVHRPPPSTVHHRPPSTILHRPPPSIIHHHPSSTVHHPPPPSIHPPSTLHHPPSIHPPPKKKQCERLSSRSSSAFGSRSACCRTRASSRCLVVSSKPKIVNLRVNFVKNGR